MTAPSLAALAARVNVSIAVGFFALVAGVLLPGHLTISPTASYMVAGVSSVIGFAIWRDARDRVAAFEPASAFDAKRINEQVKLLSSLMNTVAAGSVSVLAIAEIAKKPAEPNLILIFVAIGIGLGVNMGARGLMLHLKDEDIAAYPRQADH